MHQLKQKDVKPIREEIAAKQDGICPVSGLDVTNGDATLDHAHESSEISETTEGQIRGVLHKFVNSVEGTMRSKYKRSGLAKHITFEELLLNLYIYLMDHRWPLLHPSHAPRPRKLMKQSYNKLAKEIKGANGYLEKPIKIPDYPKSKKLTKRLNELYVQFGIYPEYYGGK